MLVYKRAKRKPIKRKHQSPTCTSRASMSNRDSDVCIIHKIQRGCIKSSESLPIWVDNASTKKWDASDHVMIISSNHFLTFFTFFNNKLPKHLHFFFSFLYHINNFYYYYYYLNKKLTKIQNFSFFDTKHFTLYHIYHFLLTLKNNNRLLTSHLLNNAYLIYKSYDNCALLYQKLVQFSISFEVFFFFFLRFMEAQLIAVSGYCL